VFAYNSSDPNIEPTQKTDRTTGMVTGEKIRVLDNDNNPLNDQFLYSTAYYDEVGRSLQNLVDNAKGGTDYQTTQYDFASKVMSVYTSHIISGGTNFTITAKNEFDKVGRLTKLHKNFNNTFYKQLAEYGYDELGELKTKRLAPGYTSTGHSEIEALTYDYNIQGWITGINKGYALDNNNYTQWDHFFGMYLGYDNRDNNFAAQQLNGNITGVIWRSQGDNTPRKYDYEYDKLYRFLNANFKQRSKPSDGVWSNTQVDFTTNAVYEDGNGNIQSMKHMGAIPGLNNGVVVDDLHYTYLPTGTPQLNGNKLQQVDDQGVLGSNNGKLGDFADGSNLNTQDYWYDVNGNLVKDLNKNTKTGAGDGVTYNFLNKPSKINLEGKSTVDFVYDASGEKLSKKVTSANGAITTTYYIGDFVYQSTTTAGVESSLNLQFVLHEEGRLKIITSHTLANGIDYALNNGNAGVTWPGGKQGVFEYFLKDYLGNTRMVLTEEYQQERYTATMEHGAASTEDQVFGKVTVGPPPTYTVTIPSDNELEATRYVNTNPATSPWPGNSTDFVKLTAVPGTYSQVRGPNVVLRVMAGDVINAATNYYYVNNNSQGQSNSNPLSDIVTSLIAAVQGGKTADLVKAQSSNVNNSLLGTTSFQSFMNPQTAPPSPTTGAPKAYLNIVFLDEQFKFIDADVNTPDVGSKVTQVSQANNPSAPPLYLQQKAPKNGWVFIYLSNESNESVYFDNFVVNQTHTAISEENHYYPFGLKIGGISSHAYNKLDSKYDYQGDNSEEESETGWDEFDLRMYDPQIGRWTAADPKDQFPSPYVAMRANPINSIDKDGGFSFGLVGMVVGTVAGSYAAYKIIENNPQMSPVFKTLIGIALPTLGAGLGYAAFESLANGPLTDVIDGTVGKKGVNRSANFGGNFRGFYAGLFGQEQVVVGGRWQNIVDAPNFQIHISLPHVQIKFIRILPYWDLWSDYRRRYKENPDYEWRGWDLYTYPFRLVFGYPVWGTYLLLREILRVPIIKFH